MTPSANKSTELLYGPREKTYRMVRALYMHGYRCNMYVFMHFQMSETARAILGKMSDCKHACAINKE
jgi:hypothetical protein